MVLNVLTQTDRKLTLRVAVIASIISFGLVVLDLWDNRDLFDPDGISYLDMADAYLRGDWQTALNGFWSPLYSWLLALMMLIFDPSGQWEFTAVHVLNIFVYLISLASFSIFMLEFLRANEDTAKHKRLPDWTWIILGYALFTWSTIQLIPLYLPEPDLIVTALVYLLFTMLLRIRKGSVTWGVSITMGVLMALGYFTKAIMFPMAFVFTCVALILTKRSRVMLIRILASFFIFISLSLPYIGALSNAKGYWTYSEVGKLNYAWNVNKVKLWRHWQGENPVHGVPLHPTRQIHDDPPMYEFATPVNATYPPWYDPSYWYEGVKVTVDLPRQLEVLLANTKHLLYFLVNTPGPATAESRASGTIPWGYERTLGPLLALFCVIVIANLGKVSTHLRIAEHWFALAPIIVVLGLYAMLHIEGRYIAAYVVVLWMVLFRAVSVPQSEGAKKVFTAILASAALVSIMTLAPGAGRALVNVSHYLTNSDVEAPFLQSGHTNWKVAEYLHSAGLRAGDTVGSVGHTSRAYWARMARLHVVAEVPIKSFKDSPPSLTFFSLDPAKQDFVMKLFQKVGVKAVLIDSVPAGSIPASWERILDTDYYVYVFPRGDSK